jgi:hypothetical protein
MSTAGKTSSSSSASERKRQLSYAPVQEESLVLRKRQLSYAPGGRVEGSRGSKRSRTVVAFHGLPSEVLDKILLCMVDSRSPLSVIKLSMVNRQFRREIAENLAVWHRLYLHWRGVIRPVSRLTQTPRGLVLLRPTFPVSVPNFQVKVPPLT